MLIRFACLQSNHLFPCSEKLPQAHFLQGGRELTALIAFKIDLILLDDFSPLSGYFALTNFVNLFESRNNPICFHDYKFLTSKLRLKL